MINFLNQGSAYLKAKILWVGFGEQVDKYYRQYSAKPCASEDYM